MNKTRIFGGFSLVEMMLLLLIVSLMIASSVAVISKRHVKVPRLAMHGAFMCYYKDGQLWEERYVGSGLNKKIVDQAAAGGDHCLFTPPDKVSYLHIQATGGGGGGGDSGYKGGDPQPHKSETEVLSPFGLTEEYLLEVKGITTAGDPAYGWGQIYAYADGRGVKGDAGDGGDLWYIHQDCANGGCLALRKWENRSNGEKGCWNQEEEVSCATGKSGDDCYRSETRNYEYNCWEDCGATNDRGESGKYSFDKTDCDAGCATYEYEENNGRENDPDFVSCQNGWRTDSYCPSYFTLSKCNASSCNEERISCDGKYMSGRCSQCGDYSDRGYEDYNYCIGYSPSHSGCSSCTRETVDCRNSYPSGDCSSCSTTTDYWGDPICDSSYSNRYITTNRCASNVYLNRCVGGSYGTGYCDGDSGSYYVNTSGSWVSVGNRVCYGTANMEDDSYCGAGSYKWTTCESSSQAPYSGNAGTSANSTCTDYYNIPNSATTCTLKNYTNFNLWVDDYYNEETNASGNTYASYMKVTIPPNAAYITARTTTDPLIMRKIARTEGEDVPTCTYGNTTLFANDGVFGSFVETIDGVNVACTTDALADAFGEGIIPITHGESSHQTAFNENIDSSEHYEPPIKYDVSEDYEGENPYGDVEKAVTVDTNTTTSNTGAYQGGPWNKQGSITYTNPFTNETYKPQKKLPTACNLTRGYDTWEDHITEKDESQCNTIRNKRAYAPLSNAYRYSKPLLVEFHPPTKQQLWKDVTYWSECVDVKSTWETFNPSSKDGSGGATELNNDGEIIDGRNESICMLSFDDYKNDGKNQNVGDLVTENNGIYTVDQCSYYPLMAEGSEGGKGTFCTLGPIDGGYNLYYHGYSGILPGIRGSNAIAIADYNNADKIKALYTKAEWESQARVYAENGTDSAGYAEIALGVGGADQTCILHPEGKNPTHGKGASKPNVGGNDGVDGTPDGRDGGYEGTNTNNAGIIGENQVGYIVSGKANPENYKYKYWYTWDTNYMQYGEGGDAGEYIVKVVRAIKDRELKIFVGKGGLAGTQGSGEDGEDGGDTIIEGVLTAKGGFGGAGGLTTPVEQMPYYREGDEFDWIKGQAGTPGGRHDNLTIKSNIMNLILPVDNSFVLQQWVEASGEGGNGGGSKNTCWASGWVRNFEGRDDPESFKDPDCRTGDEGTAEPAAEAGIDGLVLIRW